MPILLHHNGGLGDFSHTCQCTTSLLLNTFTCKVIYIYHIQIYFIELSILLTAACVIFNGCLGNRPIENSCDQFRNSCCIAAAVWAPPIWLAYSTATLGTNVFAPQYASQDPSSMGGNLFLWVEFLDPCDIPIVSLDIYSNKKIIKLPYKHIILFWHGIGFSLHVGEILWQWYPMNANAILI